MKKIFSAVLHILIILLTGNFAKNRNNEVLQVIQ